MRVRNDTESIPLSADRTLARIAAAQYGVFARDQALSAGVSRSTLYRRAESRRWETLLPGVYRVAGAPPSWHQTLMATILAWGAGAAASHRAAAAQRTVAGFEPGIIELIVPRTRQRRLPGIAHRQRELLPSDFTRVGAIPVTTVARTLIDLAAIVEREVLEEALDDVLGRRLTTVPRVLTRTAEAGNVKGIGVLRSLLEARDPRSAVPDSVFETRLLRVLRKSDVGIPVMQFEVRDGARRVAVVDFAYPGAKIAIEADGYRWHSSKMRWEHDLRRRNTLTRLGWRVMHVTWRQLHEEPDAVVHVVKAMLDQQAGVGSVATTSWPGFPGS